MQTTREVAIDTGRDRETLLNPLDWTADRFLALYGGVAAGAILLVLGLRLKLIFKRPSTSALPTSVLDLAWLSGGSRRAADAALLTLLRAGAATIGPQRGQFTIMPGTDALTEEYRFYAVQAKGIKTRVEFHDSVTKALNQVRARLVWSGLIPSAQEIMYFHFMAWFLMAFPLLLGGLRIGADLSRHRPIGILMGLEVMTACIAWQLVSNLPFRTQAGRAAAAERRAQHAASIEAPAQSDMALAFALAGSAVLAGTEYARALETGRRSMSGRGKTGSADNGH